MKNIARRFLAPLAALGVLFASANAAADDSVADRFDTEDGYGYQFYDSQLLGGVDGATGSLIKVRPMASRYSLLKYRTQFIDQLQQSIEEI